MSLRLTLQGDEAFLKSTRFDDDIAYFTALMRSGGDSRLDIDASTGLSKYGVRYIPDSRQFSFSSSTANTISARGYAAAFDLFFELSRAATRGKGSEACNIAAENVKTKLLQCRGISNTSVILGASGTDLELIALMLALSGHDRPLVNIVVGHGETGSGCMLASEGRHYGDDAPFASGVEKGQFVMGHQAGRVSVKPVLLRDANGSVRLVREIDDEVAEMVESAVAGGSKVLLHMMASSKTGLSGPSLGSAKKLAARFADDLLVTVDACQGRLSSNRFKAYLQCGFMVMTTGSKFIGGPPFSGAVLVPPTIWHRLQHDLVLPIGLREYSSQSDWPNCRAAQQLRCGANVGLLLRWEAALSELMEFDALPESAVGCALKTIESHITSEVSRFGNIDMLASKPNGIVMSNEDDDWDLNPSIYSLEIKNASGKYLDTDELNDLRQEMMLGSECGLAGDTQFFPRILIGQAVRLGSSEWPRSVLRVSIGARDLTSLGGRTDPGSYEFKKVLGNLSTTLGELSRRAAQIAG